MIPIKLISVSLLLTVIVSTDAVIDKSLLKTLNTLGKSDVLVHFSGENSQVLRNIKKMSFPNRISKVKELTRGLHSLTNSMQSPVQEFLKLHNAKSQSFWSSNQMVIHDANLWLLQGVDAFPQVKRIQRLPVVKLAPILPTAVNPKADTIQWGVAKIQADQVWSTFGTKGEGTVVANIDTGVRSTHEALSGNWRSDHGWYDPYTNTTVPDDSNGHGTHTMGTIAGAGGIGVAPGAKWIACRGCGSSSCGAAQLLACGQWMLSPTNPDGTDPQPSLIPDVVSNSWGSNIGGDDWYNATIDAWKAAGILHAFAIGNSGPACKSGGSPGDQPTTFSVGSTDVNDKLSIFSSKGPGGTFPATYTKPEIAAPGSNVYSAWCTGDSDYNTISGTSMATPHVAGTIALMLSARRNKAGNPSERMTMDEVSTLIEQTADTQNLTVSFPNYRCDSIFYGKNRYPNNQFGYGRVNALKSVNATINGPPPAAPSKNKRPSFESAFGDLFNRF